MKPFVCLIGQIVSFALILFKVSTSTNITRTNVPIFTNHGDWGPWEYCPPGQYANAFQARLQRARINFDNTGLNAVCLFCSPLGEEYDEQTSKKICSTQGQLGDLIPSTPYECPHPQLIVGFNLMNAEEKQTVGAVNVRIYCTDKKSEYETKGGNYDAEFGFPQYCLKGQAVCGIQTQVEAPKVTTKEDNTALNNLKMKCCDMLPPSSTCTPSDAWTRVVSCNNLGSDNLLTCTLEQKIGTVMTETSKLSKTEMNMISATTMAGIGVGTSFAGFGLQASFSASFTNMKTTGIEWSKERSDVFTEEVTTTVVFEVPKRTRATIYQIIGKCGIYKIQSSRFFRADTTSTQKQKVLPKLLPAGFFCDSKSESDEHTMITVKNSTRKCQPTSMATFFRAN